MPKVFFEIGRQEPYGFVKYWIDIKYSKKN